MIKDEESKDNDARFSCKHKSEIKTTMDCGIDLKFTASNKDYAIEAEYEPEMFKNDGNHASLEFEGKFIPKKEDW